MALVVGENTYGTMAEAATYIANRLHAEAWTGKTENQREYALVLAARHIDYSYEFLGSPTDSDQSMSWPRTGVLNRQGREYANDEIPVEVRDAQFELALQWIVSDQLMPGASFMTKDDSGATKGGIKRQKLGDLEIEYHGSQGYLYAIGSLAAQQKTYPYVDLLLNHLVTSRPSSQFQRIAI